MAITHREHDNGQSTVYQKLTPELRRLVDISIIERHPPTYQGIWMHYKLGEHGVSYATFYRYAHRLRDRANLAETVLRDGDEDVDLDEPIRRLLARRILENLLHSEEAPTRDVAVLLAANRQAARTQLQRERHLEQSRIAWARLDVQHPSKNARRASDDDHSPRRLTDEKNPVRPRLAVLDEETPSNGNHRAGLSVPSRDPEAVGQ